MYIRVMVWFSLVWNTTYWKWSK